MFSQLVVHQHLIKRLYVDFPFNFHLHLHTHTKLYMTAYRDMQDKCKICSLGRVLKRCLLASLRSTHTYTRTWRMSAWLAVFRSKTCFTLTLSRCHAWLDINHVTNSASYPTLPTYTLKFLSLTCGCTYRTIQVWIPAAGIAHYICRSMCNKQNISKDFK